MSATINSCYLCFSPEDTDDIKWIIKKINQYEIPDSLVESEKEPVFSKYIYQAFYRPSSADVPCQPAFEFVAL